MKNENIGNMMKVQRSTSTEKQGKTILLNVKICFIKIQLNLALDIGQYKSSNL